MRPAEQAKGTAGKRRRAAPFVVVHVAVLVGDDLVAGLGERAQRDLVGHRAGRDEQGGFLAQQLREAFL